MLEELVFIVLVSIVCSTASASSQYATYNNHSLYFEIPNGWSVVKDLKDENDTQIVVQIMHPLSVSTF